MDLSILLVNFNDRRNLAACLASLKANPPSAGHEILVIDNASTDGSRDAVASRFPDVRWIAQPENSGFSRANNLAARESRGLFLLFLNTDTLVPRGAVDELTEFLKAHPSAGAAGPALLHGPDAYQVSFGRRVNFFAQFWQKFAVNPYLKRRLKKNRRDREAGWLSAACLLCRREAFDRAGGFDENFFLFFEDIDLCVRLRQAGWKLFVLPRIQVRHAGGSTTTTDPRRRASSRLAYRRSQLYYYRKHNSRLSLWGLGIYLRMNRRRLSLRGVFRGDEGRALKAEYAELLGRGGRR